MSTRSRLRVPAVLLAILGRDGELAAQEPGAEPSVRRPTAAETGCDTAAARPAEPVFESDSVDQPVQPRRLPIEGMPIRIREVLTGRSVFRFIVEPSGRIDRCSIEVIEETSRAWSDAVLKELRVAHYEPGRKAGRPVRQLVYQVFTYHSDGRLQRPR